MESQEGADTTQSGWYGDPGVKFRAPGSDVSSSTDVILSRTRHVVQQQLAGEDIKSRLRAGVVRRVAPAVDLGTSLRVPVGSLAGSAGKRNPVKTLSTGGHWQLGLQPRTLGLGIHWPDVVDADGGSALPVLRAEAPVFVPQPTGAVSTGGLVFTVDRMPGMVESDLVLGPSVAKCEEETLD